MKGGQKLPFSRGDCKTMFGDKINFPDNRNGVDIAVKVGSDDSGVELGKVIAGGGACVASAERESMSNPVRTWLVVAKASRHSKGIQ